MQLMGLDVNLGTALTDFKGLTAMAMVGRHEFDTAVAVSVVVPVDERGDLLTGLLFGCKWLAGRAVVVVVGLVKFWLNN